MSKVLYTRHDNEVVKITLNNPARNNAFDDEIISSLISILEDIEHSDNIKLVVLDSSGKHFSAGADLNWMKRMSNCSQCGFFNQFCGLMIVMDKQGTAVTIISLLLTNH